MNMSSSELEKNVPAVSKTHIYRDIIVKNYHPIWNVAFMSTGISSGVLFNFPYEHGVFRIFGLIMWGVSLSLFLMVNVLLGSKIYLEKGFYRDLLTDIQYSVFLGPYSMGFSTIIVMIHSITHHYDQSFKVGLIIFWGINMVLSLLVGWMLVFVVFSRSKVEQNQLNPQLILLILPLSVCASAGALICQAFEGYSKHLRLTLILLTFLLVSNSIFLGFSFMAIFIWKFMVYKLPPKQMVFTLFAPIGLLGHGMWCIVLNGSNMHRYLVDYHVHSVIDPELIGIAVEYFCGMVGLFFMACGIFFTFLGIAALIFYGLPRFSEKYWIVPFPICALSIGTTELYRVFGLQVFRVVGTVYGAAGVIIVLISLAGSVISVVPWKEMQRARAEAR